MEKHTDMQQEILQAYKVMGEDTEKREAAVGMSARLAENIDVNGNSQPWRDNQVADFKAAVEILSGKTNTVIMDDWGIPSVMVRVDAMYNSELLKQGTNTLHQAFYACQTAQKEIYVSKFLNVLIQGRGYSLPMRTPACEVSFDQAVMACRRKGRGWSLSPYAIRAALALWAKKECFLPHGNSDNEVDYKYRSESGIPVGDGRVITGSGPVTWTHNRKWSGIFDLTGNLNERDLGLRLMDGEIQIIPDGNWMAADCNMETESNYWRAILPDGSIVKTGSPGTLKYDYRDDAIVLTTSIDKNKKSQGGCAFGKIKAEKGLKIPEIIYSLMLLPEEENGEYDGWRWIKTEGECLPLCGGAHKALDHAGIFFVGMTYPRSHDYNLAGFRSVYFGEA